MVTTRDAHLLLARVFASQIHVEDAGGVVDEEAGPRLSAGVVLATELECFQIFEREVLIKPTAISQDQARGREFPSHRLVEFVGGPAVQRPVRQRFRRGAVQDCGFAGAPLDYDRPSERAGTGRAEIPQALT